MNVTEPIRRTAHLTPDAPAVIRADGSVLTYALLDRAIDLMGAHARRLRLAPGDTVGLSISPQDETLGLVLLLGLARIGVATTQSDLPPDSMRLRFHAGPGAPPGSVAVDAGWMTGGMTDKPPAPPAMHRNPAATLRIFDSSGTTGTPKQIVVTHRQMAQRIVLRWIAEGGDPAVRIVCFGLDTPWGVSSALRTFWRGGTLVLSNPDDLVAAIVRHRVTSLVISPVTLRQIVDSIPEDAGPLPSLQNVIVGGSTLPPALYHLAAARLSPHIHSSMGTTETSGFVTAPMHALLGRPGAVGYIWPGVEVEALDAAGNPVPPGTAGVLRIRSPMNASGYVQADGPGEERFMDGWFYSSDIGTVWPDGMLTLSGRVNDVINAGGTKVHPHVIEAALLKLPTVLDAAAFGVPDPTGVTRIQAAIVARTRIEDAVLNDFCRVALGPLAPVGILQMKALPRNENGKILRTHLVDIALQMMRGHTHAA